MGSITLYAASHTSGSASTPNNAIGAPNNTWTNNTGSTSWISTWALTNNASAPTGTATVNAVVRKEASQSGTPTATLSLYQNGSLIASGTSTSVTSGTGQTISFSFSSALLNGTLNNLAIEVNAVTSGGGPSARTTVQVDALYVTASTPEVYSVSGTVAATSNAHGAADFPPDPNAIQIAPLTLNRGFNQFDMDVPVDRAVLLFIGLNPSPGSATVDVIVDSTTATPIATHGDLKAYLLDPGPGFHIVDLLYSNSVYSTDYFAWSISKKDGLPPDLVDFAGADSAGGGGVSVNLDLGAKGAVAAFVLVNDGWTVGEPAFNILNTDYGVIASDGYTAGSGQSLIAVTNQFLSATYSGGAGFGPDSMLAVALAFPASTGPKVAAGTVSAVGTTTGSLTKRSTVSGTVSGVGLSSGAPIKRTAAVGTVSAVSTTSGAVTLAPKPVAGTVVGTGVVSGAAIKLTQVTGTAVGTGAVTGTPTKTTSASGVVAGVATTIGDATVQSGAVTHQAAGIVSVISGTTGSAEKGHYPLTGTVAATGTTGGSITRNHYLWSPGDYVRRNLFRNPRPSTTTHFGGTAGAVTLSNVIGYGSMIRSTRTTAGNYRLLDLLTGTDVVAGERYGLFWAFRASETMTGIYVYFRPNVTSSTNQVALWSNGTLPTANIVYTLSASFTVPAAAGDLSNSGIVIVQNGSTVGSSIDVSSILLEKGTQDLTVSDFFDGTTNDTSRFNYVWQGIAGDAQSIAVEMGQPVVGKSSVVGPPRPGTLVAEYGFNEGTGETIAGTGPGAQTLNGSPAVWTAEGIYGAGFGDGTNPDTFYYSDINASGMDQFTNMVWIRPKTPNYGGMELNWGPAGIEITDSSTIRYRLDPDAASDLYIPFDTTLTMDTWTHIAFTVRREFGKIELYVNGSLTETKWFTPHLTGPANDIEGWLDTNLIDDLRYFDGILTPEEIIYQMTHSVGEPPIIDVSGTVVVTSEASGSLTLTSAAAGAVTGVGSGAGAVTKRTLSQGVTAGVSTVSGTTIFRGVATGTVTGIGVVAGTVTSRRQATGAVPGMGTTSGAPTARYTTTGAISGVSATQGAAALTGTAAGSIVGTSTLTGAVTRTLSGTSGVSPAVGVVSGAVSLRQQASGAITSIGVVTGDPIKATPATSNAVFVLSGTVGSPTKITDVPATPVAGVSTVTGSADRISTSSSTVAVVSTVSGAPVKFTSVSGTVTSQSTASGTPYKATAASSVVTGTGTTLGSVSLRRASAGVVVSVSSVSGTPTKFTDASGTVIGVGTVAGSVVSGSSLLAPSIDGVSTVAGDLTTVMPVNGQIVAESVVIGLGTKRTSVAGIVAGLGGVFAAPTNRMPVTGTTVDVVGDSSGSVTAERVISGVVTGSGTVSGTLGAESVISGQVVALSVSSGDVQKTTTGSGIVFGTGSVSGAVLTNHALSEVVQSESEVSGAFNRTRQVGGTVVGQSTVSGSANPEGTLIGFVSGDSTVSGSVTKGAAMSGTVVGSGSSEGEISRRQNVSALPVVSVSMVEGGALALLLVNGTQISVSTVSGDPIKTSEISGIVTAVSQVLGTLVQQETLSVVMNGQEVLLGSGSLTLKIGGIEYEVGLSRMVDGVEVIYWTPS